MDENQTLRSRRAMREAHKVELEREIRKRPIRSSRTISSAAGLMIGFSIVCGTGLNSEGVNLTPCLGLAIAWLLLVLGTTFALGGAWERGRTFDLFGRI